METPFAIADRAFAAAHTEDPRPHAEGGTWSAHYHARLAHWIEVLDPHASLPLRLAARAAHIRRWTVPRDSYDAGRSGYKRWRSELAQYHAAEAGRILEEAGFERDVIEKVQDILQKRRLKQDPDVQTFEDGLCMVFLENELADFARKHSPEKVVEIIQKTWGKMSERGHRTALALAPSLPAELLALVERAVAGGSGGP